ncbi:MAG: PQQ-binding-like beta-propeller repeat protein [Gemmataceae bacterium]
MSKASGWRWSAGALVLALSVLTLSTQAEPPAKKKDPGAMAASFSSLKIKEEAKYRDVVNVARDAITSKDWDRAIQALQILLDLKTDHYVQVRDLDPAGHEVLRWTSVKFEANKLLGGLPGEALDAYEIAHGAKAKAMLDDAKKTGNREEMAEVAQRYYHTRAGADANDLLGTYFLDRGQYFVAALRFEKLMAMPEDRVKITDLTLLKAALAYRRAGDTKNSDLAWKKLVGRIGDRGMKLGDELVATADLRKALDTIPVVTSVNPNDWPMIRGNQTNTAQANGSPPLLDMLLWKRPLVLDKLTEFPDEEGKEAQDQLTRALKQMEDAKDRAILPGFFPIAANKILVYRSYSDIRAVYLEDQLDGAGKVTAKAGDIAWKVPAMDGGLAKIMAATGTDIKLPTIQNWLTRYSSVVGYGSLVYENSLLGTLSTDHKYVYAIDDLAVPIPPDQFQPFIWASANVPANIKPLVMSNKLYAIDLVHGDMKWELGTKEDGFSDSHFLGVPISVGGKLYVLNEKNGGVGTPTGNSELRLICIDPSKVTGRTPQIIEPIQSLGEIEQNSRVTHYPGRRLTSAQLAYGEGVLVCPTHAGEVLGVDLASRSLAWAYPYREQAPPPLPFAPATPFPMPGIPMIPVLPTTNTQTGFFSWYPAPPAIAEGKVIFTAPDANSVHCINLRDGTPVWKKRQADGDLYMGGVYNGKVLIVNKNRVTALNLHDGRAMWTVATSDFPSGQGVASNNVYYLPLKKGEILAIDIDKGVVKAHNRARSTPTTPGNLVFYEGTVISQTPTEIMAFPQLVARLAQANIALKADPTNPVKLVDRGELFLADGQVQSAVNDLEKAIELKPAADVTKRAQTRLYEALTELLQIDFKGTNVRYLKEYDQLCKLGDTPQEQQLREAKFYRIVGQGRETLGELIDAYDNYKRFGALPIHKETGGVAGLDDPSHKVPIDIWLRARIGDMMAKATPEQREPLNRKIADEWKIVEAKKDVGEIRYFVSMFDVPFNVGRDARLRLAESIIAKGDKGAFLEAEMRLEELRISKFRKDVDGGRALATLALLEEKKGSTESLKLAAAYYRELARDFADVPVRDKITGAALFNDMATDKRFLPYLGERIVSWGDAKVAAKELPRGSTEGVGGFSFLPTGDLTPRMKSLRLVMDPSDINNIGFKLVDVGSHTTIWSKTLGTLNNPVNQKYFQFLYQPNPNPEAKFRYFHAKGHVFAVQVGSIALCSNADTGDVLWQKTLSEVSITPAPWPAHE